MRKYLRALVKAIDFTPAAAEALQTLGGGFFAFPRSAYVGDAFIQAQQASYAVIYAKQPNVRLVVDYIARTAADRTLRLYERQRNGDKHEDATHPAMETVREPNDWQEQKELLGALVRDYLIYDNAYLWDFGAVEDGRRYLLRVPPHAMGVKQAGRLAPTGYRVMFQDGTWIDLDIEEVIHFRGYSADTRIGVSPMETLRQLIMEESVRQAQGIEQVRGGLVKGGIVERPLEAPEWSQEAQERFSEGFRERLRGIVSGGTPVLEEGMHFVEAGITPKEAEMLENRRFALDLVCEMFGMNPAVFTADDPTAARAALQEDVVTPLLGRISSALDKQLVRRFYDDRHFFKFRPRREGDITKLFQAAHAAVGGSVVTADEFREEFLDLPPAPDGTGAQLIIMPGAVLGGAPDAGNPDRGRPEAPPKSLEAEEAELKAKAKSLKGDGPPLGKPDDVREKALRRQAQRRRREEYAADNAALFRRHFRRQKRAYKATPQVDSARWNNELADDLYELGRKQVIAEGDIVSLRLGGTFDPDRVENWLKAGARQVAEAVNAQTAHDIQERRAKDEAATEVLDESTDARADQLGTTQATTLANFATLEAAKQNQGTGQHGIRMKEWIWSGAAQSRHGGLAGESVPVYHPFSNGGQYPGDPILGIDQTAHCLCALDVY